MKRILTLLFCIVSITCYSQNASPNLGRVFNTISDLKTQKGIDNSLVYVMGGTVTTDFRGSFYKWDASSSEADDPTYYNVIAVNGVTAGRWIRTNQSTQLLPQGMLFRIGPFKFLSVSGVSNAQGEFVLNATLDNSTGGSPIFTSILFNSTMGTSNSNNPNDAISGSVKSVTNGKNIVYRYTKGNTVGVLGVASIVSAGANVQLQCFIVGL